MFKVIFVTAWVLVAVVWGYILIEVATILAESLRKQCSIETRLA